MLRLQQDDDKRPMQKNFSQARRHKFIVFYDEKKRGPEELLFNRGPSKNPGSSVMTWQFLPSLLYYNIIIQINFGRVNKSLPNSFYDLSSSYIRII